MDKIQYYIDTKERSVAEQWMDFIVWGRPFTAYAEKCAIEDVADEIENQQFKYGERKDGRK